MNEKSEHESAKREYCEHQRPPRNIICQKQKGHSGPHRAVIFWEGENKQEITKSTEPEKPVEIEPESKPVEEKKVEENGIEKIPEEVD